MKQMRIVFIVIIVALFSVKAWAVDPQEMPTPKKQVNPIYPEALKKAGLEGEVWLKATVDETGKVTDVSVEKATNNDFIPAATDAVKQWEFIPGTKNGKPIKVVVVIPFAFKLNKTSPREENPELEKIGILIRSLLKGETFDSLRNHIAYDARILINDRYDDIQSVLNDPAKRNTVIEGKDSKMEITSLTFNTNKDAAYLVMKTTSPKSKKSRFHSIMFMKASDGVWKIQAWHMSA